MAKRISFEEYEKALQTVIDYENQNHCLEDDDPDNEWTQEDYDREQNELRIIDRERDELGYA